MKLFSYAFVYAFVVFVLYCLIRFFRFAYVRIKAYVIRRKLSKKVVENDKKFDTEKKDD